MSDSSWQHSVLSDLGVSQRGFVALKDAPVLPSRSDAPETDSYEEQRAPEPASPPAQHSGAQLPPPPPPMQPMADAPAPAPPPAPQQQADAPAPAPVPQSPAPQQQADAPAPAPVPQPPAPQQQADAPAQAPAPVPQPPVPQPVPSQPPQADVPAPPAPHPPAPEQPAPQPVQQPHAPQPQAPEAQPQPQPQAQAQAQDATGQQEAVEPQLHEPEQPPPPIEDEFSWEAAISPVGHMAAQAPGMAQAPGVEDEETEGERTPPPGSVPPVAPQPPQEQHAGGAVPMAHEFVRKDQHGDAFMRRMGRGVKKVVGGSGAIQNQAEIAEFLQRPVPGYRQVTVVSVRGGAGKTTMAALLATELARHRTDRVLAMDADAELGSLPLRLGVRSELSLFDIAGKQPRTFEEAAQYLTRTPSGLWVLPATRGGRIAGEFTLETFEAAFSAVSRFISLAVMDCSAGILTPLHRGILGRTHSVVLVTPGTVDGALSARGALEWFAGHGGQRELLSRAVIAMVTHAPQVGADLERASQMLTAWGTPVIHVPYDRHIATGAAMDVTKVGEDTRGAVSRVAYEAFGRALGVPTH
ncbi:MinD/ParA family protein [Actinomadura sp. WMMB 499]|uniref:MinD/ParA family ATP-binding protein n=1 Tax=Actinomadura sp. WMMB 499 TaxID=1219491 RepID=UPI001248CB14|nr:MinD/ParA family protein [Actinomadura sp. WMMB 499]QFG22049.1 hypothetical protein F7P10_13895 [Actinomadura sp. WMMB 499]